MKLDSKYFDMIRAARRRDEEATAPAGPCCQWRSCERAGKFRAPRGRGRDGEFFLLCEVHIRQFNEAYNYFNGMSDAEVADFQRDAVTGHRPTWKVGANSWVHGSDGDKGGAKREGHSGPRAAGAQAFHAWRARQERREARSGRRQVRPLERKSLETLGLSPDVTREEIKARFKQLVKRHHPDVNGGDRGSEDALREIIQAYNHLKQAGLV
jgi:hypothetical protein